MEIETVKLGNKLPRRSVVPDTDAFYAVIQGSSFDIHGLLSAPRKHEIEEWQHGSLEYGLWVKDYIPFFVVSFKNIHLNFEATINMLLHKEADFGYQQFIYKPGRTVRMILGDLDTHRIVAIRAINIDADMAQKIKDTCMLQEIYYESAADLESQRLKICASTPLERILSGAAMRSSAT